jgi:uncharacterized membrane protein
MKIILRITVALVAWIVGVVATAIFLEINTGRHNAALQAIVGTLFGALGWVLTRSRSTGDNQK